MCWDPDNEKSSRKVLILWADLKLGCIHTQTLNHTKKKISSRSITIESLIKGIISIMIIHSNHYLAFQKNVKIQIKMVNNKGYSLRSWKIRPKYERRKRNKWPLSVTNKNRKIYLIITNTKERASERKINVATMRINIRHSFVFLFYILQLFVRWGTRK